MFNQTKFFPVFIVLLMLFTIACGAQSGAEQVDQSAQETGVEGLNDEVAMIELEHNEAAYEHNIETRAEIEALTPVELGEGEKLKVVATTNIAGDLVGNVGGDHIELFTMLPIGSDPHTFSPAPQDVTSVADADVVFINGLGLEEFLVELIENAGGEAPVIALATGVETREFKEHEENEAAYSQTGQDDHPHGGIDPHIWMSPHNAVTMVHNIEAALSALDPANAEAYKANAATYQAELEALDEWVMAQIATIPEKNRQMVTDHDAFGYYADRYGLKVVGAVIPAYSTNAEPSAQELAELQDAISEFGAQAVFVGTTVNPVLAEQLATDSSIELAPLYTGSLDEAGSGVETYLDFIRYNTEAIVAALQPQP